MREVPAMQSTKDLYLDLMKKCLIDLIYADVEKNPIYSLSHSMKPNGWRARLPTYAHTMIGMKRLDNLQFCVEGVLARGVPGDLIETGVWRGEQQSL